MGKGRSFAFEQGHGQGGGPTDSEDTTGELVRGRRERAISHFPVASPAEAEGHDSVDFGFVQECLHTDTPQDAHERAFLPSFWFSQQWANRQAVHVHDIKDKKTIRGKVPTENPAVEQEVPDATPQV